MKRYTAQRAAVAKVEESVAALESKHLRDDDLAAAKEQAEALRIRADATVYALRALQSVPGKLNLDDWRPDIGGAWVPATAATTSNAVDGLRIPLQCIVIVDHQCAQALPQ